MRPIFIDPKLEQEITEKGYVVLDLFRLDEMNRLYSLFEQFSHEIKEDFHSTHFSDKRAYKRKINSEINNLLEKKTATLLSAYQPIFSNFMVKKPSASNEMPLHADWTYVDENAFRSIACWIPLIETNEMNGTLGVIPFSHLFSTNWRGPKIPSPFHLNNTYIIESYGQLIPFKLGQCVFYDHRLLHYSPANKSDQIRPAINVVFTPKEASVFHYIQNDKPTEITQYEVTDFAFFTEYEHFEQPDFGKKTSILQQNSSTFEKKEIDRLLKNPHSFWKRIMRFFERA